MGRHIGLYLLSRDELTPIVLPSLELNLKGSFLRRSDRFPANTRTGITGRDHRRVPEGAQIDCPGAERTEEQEPPGLLTAFVISSTVGPCAQSGGWPIDQAVILSTISMKKTT
jgi:hypothetical protein